MGGDVRTVGAVPTAANFALMGAGIPDSSLIINTLTDAPYYLKAGVVTPLAVPSSGVTSVGLSFSTGLISVAGSPVTTTGTLAMTVAGTSGGIVYFSGANTWASSGALTASAIVLGGGAGSSPTVLGSLGTTTTVLHGNAAGNPTFAAVSLTADVTGTLGVGNGGSGAATFTAHGVLLGNAASPFAVTAVGANNTYLKGSTGADPSFATITLASADFANQGTTTTVLHGNAAGNPAFSAVVEADITLANNVTNDVSITKHGFAPIAPNDATKYLDGTGAYSVPAGGGSGTNDQILIQDQKANTTVGSTYTTGAWRTVVLQTTVIDTGSNVVSLASNAFALKAGSYDFEVISNVGNSTATGGGRLRLRNTSDATTVVQGPNFSDATALGVELYMGIVGSFTIAAQKTFEIQVNVTASTTAAKAISTGDVEVYTSIRLRKYA